jgi:hypothetical protein
MESGCICGAYEEVKHLPELGDLFLCERCGLGETSQHQPASRDLVISSYHGYGSYFLFALDNEFCLVPVCSPTRVFFSVGNLRRGDDESGAGT